MFKASPYLSERVVASGIGISPELESVFAHAEQESSGFGHCYIDTVHVLLGMLSYSGTKTVLQDFGFELDEARQLALIRNRDLKAVAPVRYRWLTISVEHALELAHDLALEREQDQVTPELLLIALSNMEQSTAFDLLSEFWISAHFLEMQMALKFAIERSIDVDLCIAESDSESNDLAVEQEQKTNNNTDDVGNRLDSGTGLRFALLGLFIYGPSLALFNWSQSMWGALLLIPAAIGAFLLIGGALEVKPMWKGNKMLFVATLILYVSSLFFFCQGPRLNWVFVIPLGISLFYLFWSDGEVVETESKFICITRFTASTFLIVGALYCSLVQNGTMWVSVPVMMLGIVMLLNGLHVLDKVGDQYDLVNRTSKSVVSSLLIASSIYIAAALDASLWFTIPLLLVGILTWLELFDRIDAADVGPLITIAAVAIAAIGLVASIYGYLSVSDGKWVFVVTAITSWGLMTSGARVLNPWKPIFGFAAALFVGLLLLALIPDQYWIGLVLFLGAVLVVLSLFQLPASHDQNEQDLRKYWWVNVTALAFAGLWIATSNVSRTSQPIFSVLYWVFALRLVCLIMHKDHWVIRFMFGLAYLLIAAFAWSASPLNYLPWIWLIFIAAEETGALNGDDRKRYEVERLLPFLRKNRARRSLPERILHVTLFFIVPLILAVFGLVPLSFFFVCGLSGSVGLAWDLETEGYYSGFQNRIGMPVWFWFIPILFLASSFVQLGAVALEVEEPARVSWAASALVLSFFMIMLTVGLFSVSWQSIITIRDDIVDVRNRRRMFSSIEEV